MRDTLVGILVSALVGGLLGLLLVWYMHAPAPEHPPQPSRMVRV